MKRAKHSHQCAMKLIRSRPVSFLDAQTLTVQKGREALFRANSSFLLYLSEGDPGPDVEERLLSLSAREAIIWLNEGAHEGSSFWA